MEKREIILAALAPADGVIHTPVQVQKLLFLIDKKIPHLVGGPYFNFVPYAYGPFDTEIYRLLEELEKAHIYIAQLNENLKQQQKEIEKLKNR